MDQQPSHHAERLRRSPGCLGGKGHHRAGAAPVQGDVAGYLAVDLDDPCRYCVAGDETAQPGREVRRVAVELLDGAGDPLERVEVVVGPRPHPHGGKAFTRGSSRAMIFDVAVLADDIRDRVEAAWAAFRAAVPDDLERPTSSGWTTKEMLAHVAFWDEAVVPVVITLFRGDEVPAGWSFGSGDLGLTGNDWPPADVHNAREAAWARARSAVEVLERCDRAHAQLVALLLTVTDEEVAEHEEYFRPLGAHYEHHEPELRHPDP